MRAPEAPGSASKRDMRDESHGRKTRAPNRCHRCIDLEGKRVAAAARAARTMDFHDVDDLIPMHHHEESPEMGKVFASVQHKHMLGRPPRDERQPPFVEKSFEAKWHRVDAIDATTPSRRRGPVKAPSTTLSTDGP